MSEIGSIRKRINKSLYAISKIYHPEIPLDKIFGALETEGVVPLQEDGTRWSGILCGDNASMRVNTSNPKIFLYVGWYKMPSGNYEINAYVS